MSYHASKIAAGKIVPRMRVYIGTDKERHPDQFKCVQAVDFVDDHALVYFFSGHVKAFPIGSEVLVTRQSIAYVRG